MTPLGTPSNVYGPYFFHYSFSIVYISVSFHSIFACVLRLFSFCLVSQSLPEALILASLIQDSSLVKYLDLTGHV